MISSQLPPGLTCYRQTSAFNVETVPKPLLSTHTVKSGVWVLLKVVRGQVRYCLDGATPESTLIEPGGTVVIEPEAPHHVELLNADSTLLLEFYRHEQTS